MYSSWFARSKGIPPSINSKKWHHFTLIHRLIISEESVRVIILMRVNDPGQRITHICSGVFQWMSEKSISGKVSKSFHESMTCFSKIAPHSNSDRVVFVSMGLMKSMVIYWLMLTSPIWKGFQYMWNFDTCWSVYICNRTSNAENSIKYTCR